MMTSTVTTPISDCNQTLRKLSVEKQKADIKLFESERLLNISKRKVAELEKKLEETEKEKQQPKAHQEEKKNMEILDLICERNDPQHDHITDEHITNQHITNEYTFPVDDSVEVVMKQKEKQKKKRVHYRMDEHEDNITKATSEQQNVTRIISVYPRQYDTMFSLVVLFLFVYLFYRWSR